MVSDKELEKLIKQKKKTRELTKEEKEENIMAWVTAFRRNFDLLNHDFLEIKNLVMIQDNIINIMADNDISTIVASRGLSKIICLG